MESYQVFIRKLYFLIAGAQLAQREGSELDTRAREQNRKMPGMTGRTTMRVWTTIVVMRMNNRSGLKAYETE